MSFEPWISPCLMLRFFSSMGMTFHFILMSLFWTFCHLQVKARGST